MTAVGRPICRRSITVFNLTFLSRRRHIIADTAAALQWVGGRLDLLGGDENGRSGPAGGSPCAGGHSFLPDGHGPGVENVAKRFGGVR